MVVARAASQRLQLTLALIKPDVTVQPHIVKDIWNMALANQFVFIKTQKMTITRERAEAFYEEHRGSILFNISTALCQNLITLFPWMFRRGKVLIEIPPYFNVVNVGKFFFNRLASFMSSGPFYAHILGRDNAIPEWRKLLGPTKVFKSVHFNPESIRGKYGLTDTRNCAHGSDSEATAEREISFFFPDFNIRDWHSHSEELYHCADMMTFDQHIGEHVVNKR